MSYPEPPSIINKKGKLVAAEHSLNATKPFPESKSIIKPSCLISEDEFVKYHKTGYIASGHYKYNTKESLKWLKISKYPLIIDTMKTEKGKIEIRQNNEKISYTKTDTEGEIVRDEKGLAKSLTDEEIAKEGLLKYDPTVVAFDEEGDAIGFASDEFGADGIWVIKDFQKNGIGLRLLINLRKQFKDERKIGQMTHEGEQLTRKYYRYLCRKKQ